mgnify:CR=1 FL=1
MSGYTMAPKKPDANDPKYNSALGQKQYERDLADYDTLRFKLTEDIARPTMSETPGMSDTERFKAWYDWRQEMKVYNDRVKEQKELRNKYTTWKDWAYGDDTKPGSRPSSTTTTSPSSTTRNNSILTGITGDTQANVQRQQLQDARRRRASLLGE